MTSEYRVEVDAGPYGLSSQDGDPAGYGLCDPLELRSSIPNVDLAPLVQADPSEATVNVIAPDASTYTFNIGDPVRVAVYSNHSGGNNYAFFGRIAQPVAKPHDLGILYTLTCVDYLADLEELSAGRVDYPEETSFDRVNRMLAENGIGRIKIDGDPALNNPLVSARIAADEGTVPLTEALEEILAGWTENQSKDETGATAVNTITCRYELAPNIVNPGGVAGHGSLDPDRPFKIVPIYRPQGWAPPARLATVPNVHLTVSTADSSPSTGSLILDAGHVDVDLTFTQVKGNAIQRVVLQDDGVGFSVADWSLWGTYQWVPATATLEATVKTRLLAVTAGVVPAAMYRGSLQPDGGLAWTVGDLTWRASRTQATGWQGPQLRRVCTVARVDAANPSSHIPTGKSWLVGVVDSLAVQVASGEVTLKLTLAPMHYTNTGPLVVPHQGTLADMSTYTYAQLAPTDTFADYLLMYA